MAELVDALKRPLHDLRISVTDRCNFRCVYCMPKEVFGPSFAFLPRRELLTFEEIARLAAIFRDLGVHKLRITGGEPLVRRDLDTLIERLHGIDGIDDIAMTSNGALLTPDRAKKLAEAGLHRVTISLDSLDDEVFQSINDVGFPVNRVLDAIQAAAEAGLTPVKINMVVKRGVNDQDVVAMAGHFRQTGQVLRFIEYMDVGTANGWRMDDVVPAQEIVERIRREWPIEPVDPDRPGDVARRYRYLDGGGEFGVITSVTQPFCGACSRARLSPEGQLYLCLFGQRGYDLRTPLRDGATDDEIRAQIVNIWRARNVRYSEERSERTTSLPKVEMFRIGG